MSAPVRDLDQLLRTLEPRLEPGTWVFASLPPGAEPPAPAPLATFREAEGLTLVVREEEAKALGLAPLYRAAWISLTVHSDLAAVGLTAAVSAALTARGISCNVVAAAYHDHLFVPVERAGEALEALAGLAARAREASRA